MIQVAKGEDGVEILQLLGFVSKNFSEPATRWSTIEQECYGIYHAVNSFAYYLYGKHFILETDHRNLVWIESSIVPKIVRWRVYLQSFSFQLRHIAGKLNNVADQLSRLFRTESHDMLNYVENRILPGKNDLEMITSDNSKSEHPAILTMLRLAHFETDHELRALEIETPTHPTPEDILSKVHGGRSGHPGARRTWLKLNELFPGHRIPQAIVNEYVASCPACQKARLHMTSGIEPIVRHIKPKHHRSAIGIDTLTVTPKDSNGNEYCVVIVNLFTKHTKIYPCSDKSAITTARILFRYFTDFGRVDAIHSDQGSDFMANVTKALCEWFGIEQVFALIDRHESSVLRQQVSPCSSCAKSSTRLAPPRLIKLLRRSTPSWFEASTSCSSMSLRMPRRLAMQQQNSCAPASRTSTSTCSQLVSVLPWYAWAKRMAPCHLSHSSRRRAETPTPTRASPGVRRRARRF